MLLLLAMEIALPKDLVKKVYGLTFIVRIGRIWEPWSIYSSGLYGLNFVMVVRKGGTAEDVIPSDKMNKFKNIIPEGVVYRIQCYLIVRAKEKYRAVDSANLLYLVGII